MTDLASARDRILDALRARFAPKTVDTVNPVPGLYYRIWDRPRVFILRVGATQLAVLDANPPVDMAKYMDDLGIFQMLETLPLSSHVVWNSNGDPRIDAE